MTQDELSQWTDAGVGGGRSLLQYRGGYKGKNRDKDREGEKEMERQKKLEERKGVNAPVEFKVK